MKKIYKYENKYWLILSIIVGLIASSIVYKSKDKTFRVIFDKNFDKYEVYIDSIREF